MHRPAKFDQPVLFVGDQPKPGPLRNHLHGLEPAAPFDEGMDVRVAPKHDRIVALAFQRQPRQGLSQAMRATGMYKNLAHGYLAFFLNTLTSSGPKFISKSAPILAVASNNLRK